MKIIVEKERETKMKKIFKKKDIKKQRGGSSYSKSVRAKWLCSALKLGFVQLICTASLIFKSNLKLPLLIILKGENMLR